MGPPPLSCGFSPLPGGSFQSPRTSLNILVVDDNDAARNALARFLRHCNFQVSCAVDGECAWDELRKGNFDGMVTDNDMPRLSGLDLVRRLRAIPSRMPIILMSGLMPHTETDFEALITPGMAIEKPFSFALLEMHARRLFTRDLSVRAALNGDYGKHGEEQYLSPQ
ncbi:MAG: response regulator [Nibricoccus sp.]